MVVFLVGNAVALLIAIILRRSKAVMLPIIAVGLFGAMAAGNMSVSLKRSDDPQRRSRGANADFNDGYSTAVKLVERSAVPFASMYLTLVLISLVAVAARPSGPKGTTPTIN